MTPSDVWRVPTQTNPVSPERPGETHSSYVYLVGLSLRGERATGRAK